MDDFERLRIERDWRRLGFSRPTGRGSRAFLGRVTTASPTAGTFISVIPQGVLGAETEGGAGTSTDLGSTPVLVYLVGGTVMTGDQVVSRLVDYRWVTRRRSSGGGITTCGCSSLASRLYVSIPGLGLSSFPLNFASGLGAGWAGCANVSVLGYPLCSSFTSPCSPAMVTAAFTIQLLCGSVGGVFSWILEAAYNAYGNNVCDVPASPTKQSRALDLACGVSLTTCAGPLSSSLPGGAAWTTPFSCTRPTAITFAGPPIMDTRTPVNLYFGTGASVSE